jgi:hypothetical protein
MDKVSLENVVIFDLYKDKMSIDEFKERAKFPKVHKNKFKSIPKKSSKSLKKSKSKPKPKKSKTKPKSKRKA